MTSFEHFKLKILPEILDCGSFGSCAKLTRITADCQQGKDQFASAVQFVDIEVDVSGSERMFSTVCKFQPGLPERRKTYNTGLQFFNEVLVYKDILPLLPKSKVNIFPAFYYGVATTDRSPEDDVVIVENLIPKGYKQTSERIFLDYEHCLLVFKRLGEFHGESLRLKSTNGQQFIDKLNQLVETRWMGKCNDEQYYFYKENAKRGIIPLIKNGEQIEVLNNFLNQLEDLQGIIEHILEVNENSLLCHGDFCRNNMIFKYEDGQPVDVKFYDLGTARYSSPMIDISFFVFLNISSDLRQRHIQDFFLVYRKAMVEVAGSAATSINELWKEFQQKAVYGYILVAFFLPIMMDEQPRNESYFTLPVEERVRLNLLRGGQKVTDVLAKSVRDLISWGCLPKDVKY